MKLFRYFLFLFIVFIITISCFSQNDIIIPKPQKVIEREGVFNYKNFLIENVSNSKEAEFAIEFLNNGLYNKHQNRLKIYIPDKVQRSILFIIDTSFKQEAYSLDIKPDTILIKAKDSRGFLYGVQSLLQSTIVSSSRNYVKCMYIEDYPRFEYRGGMLDVSRHFAKVEQVKQFIDYLAAYKLNYFHLHLTDAAGWRIEIKKYPLLTNISAFRDAETWKKWAYGQKTRVKEGDSNAFGGYYTQEEIRDIVEYAKQRHITIIPEIEMPGHSDEVFMAYPEFSCFGKSESCGEFCLGNDKTYEFLKDVLEEIIELFPSEYIHIGGDEVSHSNWKKCPKCQKRMQEKGLLKEVDLHRELIKEMEVFLKSKNRKLIGWDEVLESEISPQATIMVWRGRDVIKKSLEGNYPIIETSKYYFDSYQADPTTQPEAIGGFNSLRKVYNTEPTENLSEGLNNFKGIQFNIFREFIPNFKHTEYMMFPRVLAFSETAWTMPENKDWEDFLRRREYVNIPNACKEPNVDMITKTDTINKCIYVSFETDIYKPKIWYIKQGSKPNFGFKWRCKDRIKIKGKESIDVYLGWDNNYFKTFRVDYHKAIGGRLIYNKSYCPRYPAGKETALIDGQRGTSSYFDGKWQGLVNDLDVVIDLQKPTKITEVRADFMQMPAPGIYFPKDFVVYVSNDGVNFKEVAKYTNTYTRNDPLTKISTFGVTMNEKARYIQIKAENDMKGYIFIDEIVVF